MCCFHQITKKEKDDTFAVLHLIMHLISMKKPTGNTEEGSLIKKLQIYFKNKLKCNDLV